MCYGHLVAHLAKDRQHLLPNPVQIFSSNSNLNQKLHSDENVDPSNAVVQLRVLHLDQTKDITMCYGHLVAQSTKYRQLYLLNPPVQIFSSDSNL
jgi:hypothetical protein